MDDSAVDRVSDPRLSDRNAPKKPTLLDRVHSELTLRQLSGKERLALGAISLCAFVLFAALQHDRVFTGDEVGTLNYLKESPRYLLTHFRMHLTMNYFILAEKGVAWLCGATDWRLTLLPLAAAVAIIPLTASLALKFTGSTRTALIAASLAAFNPYLLMIAPMIRAYSLLVACSLLAINEFLNWYRQRDWWSGGRCAAAVLLLLLIHLNGVYTVAFLILLLAVETVSLGWSGGRKFLWESKTLWIPLAGAALLTLLAYWRLFPDIAKVNRLWGTDTPPTSMGYLPQIFTWYMGFGYAASLSALVLLAGSWSAAREKRGLLLLCGAIILGPVLMSLQGVSVVLGDRARYLVFSLPLLLILMAEGIDWLVRQVRIRKSAAVAAWGLTAVLLLCWTPYLHRQFVMKEQLPLARLASFLHAQMQKNDVIVTGWRCRFTLAQFFEHSEDRIMLPDSYLSKVATQLDAPGAGRVFYVTGLGLLHGRTVPIQRFGQLDVATYSGDTARALLQEWREDLVRRTSDRIFAPFQGDYRLLALIEEQLPSGQSADHWRSLAERCRALSERSIPPHLLKSTRTVMFP
jgi:hypothetical protein